MNWDDTSKRRFAHSLVDYGLRTGRMPPDELEVEKREMERLLGDFILPVAVMEYYDLLVGEAQRRERLSA